jgi:excisionase family DNA binding protein
MATKAAIPNPRHAELLARREVAARFGVAPQTITRWANEGILPSVRTLGGQRRYPADEVERLVSAVWEQGPAAESPPGCEAGGEDA